MIADCLLAYPFAAAPVANAIIDASGQGNAGTNHGATWSALGKRGGGMLFDGVDDYVQGPDLGIDEADDWTIAFWAGLAAGSNEGNYMAALGNSAANEPIIGLICNGDAARLYVRDAESAAVTVDGTAVINDGALHHIMAVKDGKGLALYVDNTADGTGTLALGATTFDRVAVGCLLRGDGDAFFNGMIDEVRIFNRALGAGERTAVFNGLDLTSAADNQAVLVRERVAYVLDAINTSESLGFHNVFSYKTPRWPVARSIAISGCRTNPRSDIVQNNEFYFTARTTFIVTVDVYWGNIGVDYDDFADVEEKSELIAGALEAAKAIVDGIPAAGARMGTEIFDSVYINTKRELYVQDAPDFPRGHQLELIVSGVFPVTKIATI